MDGFSHNFFCSTPKRSCSSTPFRFCRYLHRFQRYLCSNSKVVVNRTDFERFLLSQILRGAVPPKVVSALTSQPRGTSSAKVSSSCTPNSEVISAPLLHFKPIFDPPFEKSCKGGPCPRWGMRIKTWSFYSACKNLGAQHPLGAEIWSSEKCV